METIGFVSGQSSTHKAPDIGKTLHRRFSFHMFCFSESRLNDHIDDKEVSIAGFHIIRKDALDAQLFIQASLYISMSMFLLNALPGTKNTV